MTLAKVVTASVTQGQDAGRRRCRRRAPVRRAWTCRNRYRNALGSHTFKASGSASRRSQAVRSAAIATTASQALLIAYSRDEFTANAAWLVLAVIAFNLTRTAATISGTALAKATTATIRAKLISIPARVATSARRVTLHLPTAWPLGNRLDPPVHPRLRPTDTRQDLTTQPAQRDRNPEVEPSDSKVSRSATPLGPDHRPGSSSAHVTTRSVD